MSKRLFYDDFNDNQKAEEAESTYPGPVELIIPTRLYAGQTLGIVRHSTTDSIEIVASVADYNLRERSKSAEYPT
ncbi:hypothetical protein C9I28_22885 [Pseudoduganella armeniaca]|uniref:Uncharacterized protein n=1 Tax=Pseudoduganella armeniaca TaxID=2072590 RepID=A0A2R4CEU9_9BURK|nr:hypothetical protein C9I28_22885 [Pseudoduganella armeniaca]